jgi:hypothetical protein
MVKEILFIYSKYSTHSKNVMDIINENNITGFRYICIDNKNVRKLIINNIKTVPCLIIVNSNGIVEEYTGTSLLDYINSLKVVNTNVIKNNIVNTNVIENNIVNTNVSDISQVIGEPIEDEIGINIGTPIGTPIGEQIEPTITKKDAKTIANEMERERELFLNKANDNGKKPPLQFQKRPV